MNIKDFCDRMNELCPLDLQEEWDNCGLQLESGGEVNNVLVALEVTNAVIDEAAGVGADMIVTHHPMFFGAFKQITEDTLPTSYAMKLIRAGISVYSAHTNFDTVDGGNNDYLAKLIGVPEAAIEKQGILRHASIDHASIDHASMDHVSIDHVSMDHASIDHASIDKESNANNAKDYSSEIAGNNLHNGINVAELSTIISEKLEIQPKMIRLIGNPNDRVDRLAWCTGAGAEFLMDVYDLGADLYITGDIKYHDAMTAAEFGLNVLDIGHFGSEKIFTPNMTEQLKKAFPELQIVASVKDKDPFSVL